MACSTSSDESRLPVTITLSARRAPATWMLSAPVKLAVPPFGSSVASCRWPRPLSAPVTSSKAACADRPDFISSSVRVPHMVEGRDPCEADIPDSASPRRTQPPTQRLPVVAAPP